MVEGGHGCLVLAGGSACLQRGDSLFLPFGFGV